MKSVLSPINWKRFQLYLTILRLKRFASMALRRAFSGKFGLAPLNYKFPDMDANDIRGRVGRLQQVLGLDKPLECKLLSERTVLIKKKSQ